MTLACVQHGLLEKDNREDLAAIVRVVEAKSPYGSGKGLKITDAQNLCTGKTLLDHSSPLPAQKHILHEV